MSYSDVFGGELIFPTVGSYTRIDTAVDVQLQWATEQQIEGVNVVADVLDINCTTGGLVIDMPDARNTSTGNKTTINAIGQDFTLRDATGGVIQFAPSGTAWVIVLTDNSTEAGTWTTFQLGAGTTIADAAALAGAGLQADMNGDLEQIIDSDEENATPFDVVTGDRAKCLIYTGGAGTCNIDSQPNNFFFMLRNSGSGTLNIVPDSGTIDGSANINLDPDGSCFIFTDGTNWFTIGLTVPSVIAFDFVSIAVPGSGDFVLSGANLNRISYRFTGALTGNRRIVVPDTTQQYWVDNQTTGAFDLEISTNLGSGQTVPQGESAITYCDATDVINAVSSTSITFPVLISQGGTSATTASGARANLNAAFDGILINTLANSGLAGGGDLTADRDLTLDIDNLDDTPSIATADFIAFEDTDDGQTYKAPITDLDALLQPSDLFFSGASVLEAIATNAVDLKSTGNTDAEPRELRFTRNDGTIALFIGNDNFSEEMFIENRINHPDGDILINTTGTNTFIRLNNRLRVDGTVRVRGAGSQDASISWTDTSYGGRASIGFPSSDVFTINNAGINNGVIAFEGENTITSIVSMMEMRPNTGVQLFYNLDGAVARCAPAASGGFEVNNTLTGAGFERVLTESDVQITTGQYTGTFTGMSGVVNATIDYTVIEDANGEGIVYLYDQAGSLGTSNANTMTLTGAPAAIRPSNTVSDFTNCLDNSANSLSALSRMDSAGTITFSFPTAANNYSTTGWSASNLKGLLSGWSMSYRLN